ncbi:MAG TPA: hypothetical protein PKA64_10790, partial [Myxococcota bacterium]|nr:hypothetical protein [Myxococcota bacterium]
MPVPDNATAYAVKPKLPLPDLAAWEESEQHLTVIDTWVDVAATLQKAKADTYAIEIYADVATITAGAV